MSDATRQRLVELVAPPRRPTTVDWEAAERALGLAFPQGYRWLAETYGPGVFDDQLRLLVPGDTFLDLVAKTADHAELNRFWLREPYPPPFPWLLHPEPGGLVAWADTVDRNALFWATKGPPEDWPVVVESYEDLGTWVYDGPAEDLLLALLEGTADVPYISAASFSDPHYFTPASAVPAGAVGSLVRGVRRLLPKW